MKSITNKNKIKSKKYILLVIALLVLIAGVSIYAFASSDVESNNSSSQNSDKSSTDIVKDTDGKGAEQPDTLPNNSQSLTTEDVPVNTTATATITQLEEKDAVVHFSAKVSGTNELGRCVVTFSTPNDRPVTKEFDAIKSGSDYICSVDVSSLEFSYLGKWDVNLRYYSEDTQVTVTSEVTIS